MKIVDLKPGDTVTLDGRRYLVDMVNRCRARLKPLDKRKVAYTTAEGQVVEFEASGGFVNVTPRMEVDQ